MRFNRAVFIAEMKELVDHTVGKLTAEKPKYEIYSASIWTDPNAAVSAVNFDSKKHSDKKMAQFLKTSKKYYDYFMAQGDLETAGLWKEPRTGRNDNPADFELRNFLLIDNSSIPKDWEYDSDRRCWRSLQPALMIIGDYAFEKFRQLKVHPEFLLGVNGVKDWYQFTWPK